MTAGRRLHNRHMVRSAAWMAGLVLMGAGARLDALTAPRRKKESGYASKTMLDHYRRELATAKVRAKESEGELAEVWQARVVHLERYLALVKKYQAGGKKLSLPAEVRPKFQTLYDAFRVAEYWLRMEQYAEEITALKPEDDEKIRRLRESIRAPLSAARQLAATALRGAGNELDTSAVRKIRYQLYAHYSTISDCRLLAPLIRARETVPEKSEHSDHARMKPLLAERRNIYETRLDKAFALIAAAAEKKDRAGRAEWEALRRAFDRAMLAWDAKRDRVTAEIVRDETFGDAPARVRAVADRVVKTLRERVQVLETIAKGVDDRNTLLLLESRATGLRDEAQALTPLLDQFKKLRVFQEEYVQVANFGPVEAAVEAYEAALEAFEKRVRENAAIQREQAELRARARVNLRELDRQRKVLAGLESQMELAAASAQGVLKRFGALEDPAVVTARIAEFEKELDAFVEDFSALQNHADKPLARTRAVYTQALKRARQGVAKLKAGDRAASFDLLAAAFADFELAAKLRRTLEPWAKIERQVVALGDPDDLGKDLRRRLSSYRKYTALVIDYTVNLEKRSDDGKTPARGKGARRTYGSEEGASAARRVALYQKYAADTEKSVRALIEKEKRHREEFERLRQEILRKAARDPNFNEEF